MNKEGKSDDKFFYFCETWIISIFLFLFLLLTMLNYLLDFNSAYQNFIEITLSEALDNLKSSLLSIAAIFIGIYVTVFTILGSIKVDSVFAYLNEYTFRKLITYIRNAFIASFSYLVLIMFLEVSFQNHSEIYFWLIVLNAAIVIYMFLTALRFGIILYLSFSKDLSTIQSTVKNHKEKRKEIEDLQYRLDRYLKSFEDEQINEQSRKMSEIINQNKNKKET